MKRFLTDDLVAAVAVPTKGELVLSDTQARGLRVKITPAGSRVFFLQYTAGSKLRKLTLGPAVAGGLSVRDARNLHALTMGRVREGRDPQLEKMQAAQLMDAAPTLAQAWAVYDARVVGVELKVRVAEEYRRMWAKYLPAALKAKCLADITKATDPIERSRRVNREDMRSLKDRMAPTPTMANNVLKMLKAFFNWCEGDGELTAQGSSPLYKFKMFEHQHRRFVFSPEQLRRLAAVLVDEEPRTWPPAIMCIRFLLMSGFRKEEALGLRWDMLNLDQCTADLPDTKTGASFRVLGQGAVETLKAAKAFQVAFPSPFVFPSPKDRTLPFVGLQKVWGKLRKKAELPEVRLHDLRHNFGGYGAKLTSDPVIVRDLLGHANLGTTDRYMKSQDNTLTAAANATTAAIAADMRSNIVSIPGR